MSAAFHSPDATAARSAVLSPAGALPLACAACAVAGAVYIGIDDPSDGGGLTPCPVRAITSAWCPGCGLTRATHHLVRGNVAQALSFNALVPLILAALAATWFVWLRVATGHGVPESIKRIRTRAYVGAGAALLAFTVLRNIDGFVALRGG